jgi:hypothetical protein
MTAARNVTGFEMWSYALTRCQNPGERWQHFYALTSFQKSGERWQRRGFEMWSYVLTRLWSFKVNSLFPQSANFSRFGDNRMGSSMLFDKGHFNYRFGFVGLMMECVSNVRFLISCQTSIRWGVTEQPMRCSGL